MSNVATVSIWNGMPVKSFTDMKTGEMKLFVDALLIDAGDVLATSTPSNGSATWTINNLSRFLQVYNSFQKKNNKPELSEKDFKKVWNTTGTKAFNNIRGTQLNNSNNYFNKGIAPNEQEQLQKQHFKNKIPAVIDPVTKIKVNLDGSVPSQQNTGQQLPGGGNGGGDGDDDGNSLPTLGDGETNNLIGETEELDRTRRELEANEAGIRRGGGKNVTYRYPLDEPGGPFEYDYISITAHDYVASGLNVGGTSKGKEGDYYSADKNLGQAYEQVIFPMQPQLSETNAVNWSDDQLNPIQAALGQAAFGIINKAKFTDPETTIKNIKSQFGDLVDKASNFLKDDNTRQAVAAYFAGQAVGANVQGRLTGTVVNPNLELLFNGPNLRTFNFNFRLTPRTPQESEVIRKIIFAFKRNMAAQRSKTGLYLRSPRIFQLKYIYKNGGQHPYLNKFKPCAMSNFTVNYTPDGSYATFDQTGSLTAYDLTMSFSEVMPIYASDNEYTDNPQDMGF